MNEGETWEIFINGERGCGREKCEQKKNEKSERRIERRSVRGEIKT